MFIRSCIYFLTVSLGKYRKTRFFVYVDTLKKTIAAVKNALLLPLIFYMFFVKKRRKIKQKRDNRSCAQKPTKIVHKG